MASEAQAMPSRKRNASRAVNITDEEQILQWLNEEDEHKFSDFDDDVATTTERAWIIIRKEAVSCLSKQIEAANKICLLCLYKTDLSPVCGANLWGLQERSLRLILKKTALRIYLIIVFCINFMLEEGKFTL